MPILASDRRRRGALARPHRTFLPLLPSCRAIVQVEMRSYCVHDALLWRQDAAAAVLSPSTSDVCIALAIMQGDRSSRDALEALMVLDAAERTTEQHHIVIVLLFLYLKNINTL